MRYERIRHLRESRGLTQEELGEAINMAALQIWRYENGKTKPDSEVLTKIAIALNTSSDYLLGLSDDESAHIRVDNLTSKERHVLAAMRKGDVIEAVKTLVSD